MEQILNIIFSWWLYWYCTWNCSNKNQRCWVKGARETLLYIKIQINIKYFKKLMIYFRMNQQPMMTKILLQLTNNKKVIKKCKQLRESPSKEIKFYQKIKFKKDIFSLELSYGLYGWYSFLLAYVWNLNWTSLASVSKLLINIFKK